MEDEHDTTNRTVDCMSPILALPRETGTKNKVRVSSSKFYLRGSINLDQSRRSNNRKDHHLVANLMIPEYFPALSFRISDALDIIGAGKCTVMERRETYIRRESSWTIFDKLMGYNNEYFHFGSQSEGTTTPGLMSDIDFLISWPTKNIMTDWRDWEAGAENLLMLRDDINPPQQYLLQVIKEDTPEAAASIDDEKCVKKDSGQVLLSSERWKQELEHSFADLGEITKHGPSVSPFTNWDIVHAFHVRKLLPEIQQWVDICKGKHWPPAQLLEAARVAPSFLVPAGHPDSDYTREEWRLSPNLIERMLMFSFNMTQIKCYIVLKLIKTFLFNKMVGDFTTSFHCKTIMFYTIERTHSSMWKDHNLMFLLVLCLQVLRTWLRLGIFPHYIIIGVNLFDGKLSMVQQRRLLQYVDFLLKSDLQDVFYIGIDKLGYRLQACGTRRIGQAGEGELGPVCLRYSISLLLKFDCLQSFLSRLRRILYEIHTSNTTFQQDITHKLLTLSKYSNKAKWKTVALEFINHLYALHNSIQSCKCLRLRNPAFSDTLRRFQYSLNTDVASSRLKLASTLYCFGHLRAAVRVLEDVEKGYHSKIKAVCGCRTFKGESDIKVFANMVSYKSDNAFSEPPFELCVKFVKEEECCAPGIMWFELNRGMTEEEVAMRRFVEKQWMDCAEVDARPFHHYLQYLTYGGLGERDKQLHAFGLLVSYIYDPRNNINMYHPETVLNLLGHCYEMEGDYEGALHYYRQSLRYSDTNNAANWHLQRVQRLIRNCQ